MKNYFTRVISAVMSLALVATLFAVVPFSASATTVSNEHNGRDMTLKSSVYDNTIFDDSVMYQEIAFFYEGRNEYQLLYPIDEIITVRSYDLATEYHEGTDFTIKNGKLYLTDNTNIPLYKNSASNDMLTVTSSNMWDLAGYWGTLQWKYQLHISYTHSKNWDNNALYVKGLEGQLSTLYKFHQKASSGETTNIAFIGDSITMGCNASGMDIHTYKYTGSSASQCEITHTTGWSKYYGLSERPTWANDDWSTQITNALKEKYGDNIVMTNRGMGSTNASWATSGTNMNFLYGEGEGTSNMPTPDLAFIAYGMNEIGNTKETQNELTKKIIDFLRKRNPDCSIVLVSAFAPNWPSNLTFNLDAQEDGYYELAEEYDNMIVAPVYSIFESMLTAKQVFDYTGNMLNHPSDFGVNVYADTILAVLGGCAKHTYTNKCDNNCNACGAIRTIAHTYKNTVIKATKTKNGSIVKKCSVCGKATTKIVYAAKTIKLAKTAYTYKGKQIKPAVTVKAANGAKITKANYTVTYRNNKKVGTAKVIIKGKGNYSFTVTKTFKINPKATKITSLKAGKKAFTVKYKKQTSGAGYEIQYSTSKKFTKKTTDVAKIKKNKTVSKTVKKLKAKKKYYVRVRTFKKVSGKTYYSSWSTVKKVTTKK